jgi:hypothetical protein
MPPTFLIFLFVVFVLPILIGVALAALAFVYGRRIWRRRQLTKSVRTDA